MFEEYKVIGTHCIKISYINRAGIW